jgi:dihydrofolate reductase
VEDVELTITEFVSLDGVTQGPGAPDEDTRDGFDRGGWFVPYVEDDFLTAQTGWVGQADAFLFGARTYADFSQAWPGSDDELFAPQLNGRPKHVVSTSAVDTSWGPVTIHRDLSGIPALKATEGRELQVHGSTTLAWSLLAAGLVDRIRLVVAPVVVGSGRRFFPLTGPVGGWRTVTSQVTSAGAVLTELVRADDVAFGTYPPER